MSEPNTSSKSISLEKDNEQSSSENTETGRQTTPSDLEKAATKDRESSGDRNLVDWDKDDPDCPRNWSTAKTWSNLGVISFFRLLTPLASSMIAPVTSLVLTEFETSNETIGSFVVSIYILGYALGPLFLAPLSEIYGRLPV